jgi:hypothetical protein
MLMVDTNAWSNSTAYTAYTSLTQGTTFTVTMPLTSSTPYTMTLTTNWTASGPGLTAQATSSSPLTLGSGPDNVPSSVTLAGSGGGGADITGTAQLLYNGYSGVGAAKGGIGGYGTLTSTPDVVQFFQYSSGFMATLIMFVEGSSSGLTISNADINGHTTISVTCNGVTASSVGGTVDMGGTYLRFTIPGDPFGIEAATGTSKDFSITLA